MMNRILIFFFISLFFSCGNSVPRKPILRKSSTEMKESVSFNKALNETEENAFKIYMKADSIHNYIASPKGFWYFYNNKSDRMDVPKFGDEVIYTYEVYDLNNHIIYSEEEVGQQVYVIDKQEIVEGLRNGLKLMKEGENITFLFPSHKMFGFSGDENKIGINQQLIYKVQLNKLNKKNENN
jgi:gliding motility-associated peptidyl-prolyl isomerase